MPSPMCHHPGREVVLQLVRSPADAQLYAQTRTDSNMHTLPEGKALFKRLSAHPAFLVLSGAEVLLGTASLVEQEPGIATVGLFILPQYRHRGYGALVLQAIEAEARARGFFALRADIFNDNTTALSFFQGQGYRSYQLLEKAL